MVALIALRVLRRARPPFTLPSAKPSLVILPPLHERNGLGGLGQFEGQRMVEIFPYDGILWTMV